MLRMGDLMMTVFHFNSHNGAREDNIPPDIGTRMEQGGKPSHRPSAATLVDLLIIWAAIQCDTAQSDTTHSDTATDATANDAACRSSNRIINNVKTRASC